MNDSIEIDLLADHPESRAIAKGVVRAGVGALLWAQWPGECGRGSVEMQSDEILSPLAS